MRGGSAATGRESFGGPAIGMEPASTVMASGPPGRRGEACGATAVSRRKTASGPPRTRSAGLTLIELTVALAIGAFLLLGATTVFVQSRATFRVTESMSRLQENAVFALDRLQADIRMAAYWGLNANSTSVAGRAGPGDPTAFTVRSDCANNWSVNLDFAIDGSNNGFPALTCSGSYSRVAQPFADMLVVRRVAVDPDPAPDRGVLYVQSAYFEEGSLFVGPNVPAGYSAATSQAHRLIVNGYYVSRDSTISEADNPVPSLRVKTLTGGSRGPRIVDQEVLPGVEDLQIRLGVDTDSPGSPNRGLVDRYVDFGSPLLDPALYPDTAIVAVRLWLRVRAERPEAGFVDLADYEYADRNESAPGDRFRRVVVSRTIYLRNLRPVS